LPESQRREFLLEEYKKALRVRAKVKYVSAFSMFDNNNSLLYWLIFCTNNLRGLEEMKKAMWKVDGTGGFRFSDRDNPDQFKLLNETFDQRWLAEELSDKLTGRTLSVSDVREYVLIQTPCCVFKDALKFLEYSDPPRIEVVSPPAARRRGSFKEESIQVRFV